MSGRTGKRALGVLRIGHFGVFFLYLDLEFMVTMIGKTIAVHILSFWSFDLILVKPTPEMGLSGTRMQHPGISYQCRSMASCLSLMVTRQTPCLKHSQLHIQQPAHRVLPLPVAKCQLSAENWTVDQCASFTSPAWP